MNNKYNIITSKSKFLDKKYNNTYINLWNIKFKKKMIKQKLMIKS